MAYTPPAYNAANFTAYPEYLEPGRIRHAFGIPVVGYVEPAGNALAFVESWYPYPHGLAANFKVPTQSAVTWVGEATLEFFPEGHFLHEVTPVFAAGSVFLDFLPEGHFAHGVKGAGVATLDFTPEAHAKHGVKGAGAATLDFTPAGVGLVVRYEVRGEVRLQGALVNRRVRTYNRATGALIGDHNTVGGKFKVHAGFAAEEHYIIPIDLASDATDFLPPCANRVTSVLASDIS